MKATGIVLDPEVSVDVEPSPTILYDRSRFGSDGDFKADGHPDWVRLPSGLWVMDFDASAPDYVEVTCPQCNFTSEDFSGVVRVKIDSLATRQYLLSRGSFNADGWYTQVYDLGWYLFASNQGAAHQYTYSAAGSLVANTWYTLGFSRSGASVKIYIDGADSTDITQALVNPATCARTAKIGTHDDKTTEPFGGKIGLLRIFNYALSPGQHLTMHEALKRGVL